MENMRVAPRTIEEALGYAKEGAQILRQYFEHLKPGVDFTTVLSRSEGPDPIVDGNCYDRSALPPDLTGAQLLEWAFRNIEANLQWAEDAIGFKSQPPK